MRTHILSAGSCRNYAAVGKVFILGKHLVGRFVGICVEVAGHYNRQIGAVRFSHGKISLNELLYVALTPFFTLYTVGFVFISESAVVLLHKECKMAVYNAESLAVHLAFKHDPRERFVVTVVVTIIKSVTTRSNNGIKVFAIEYRRETSAVIVISLFANDAVTRHKIAVYVIVDRLALVVRISSVAACFLETDNIRTLLVKNIDKIFVSAYDLLFQIRIISGFPQILGHNFYVAAQTQRNLFIGTRLYFNVVSFFLIGREILSGYIQHRFVRLHCAVCDDTKVVSIRYQSIIAAIGTYAV